MADTALILAGAVFIIPGILTTDMEEVIPIMDLVVDITDTEEAIPITDLVVDITDTEGAIPITALVVDITDTDQAEASIIQTVITADKTIPASKAVPMQ